MLTITEQEIRDRLAFDNPWWEAGGTIESRFQNLPRRSYFAPFYGLLTDHTINRAVVLLGPRRVGKTVMVYHAIQRLLEEGVPGTNILYISIETPVYIGLALEKLLGMFLRLFGHKRGDALYIFFDEVQYLKDWEIHLKSLVDSYGSYRFIATGSAAAALRLKSSESGAGRFSDFLLPPLTFAEYLRFIGREEELITPSQGEYHYRYHVEDIEELNKEFVNYLNYGGYPEAVSSERIRAESAQFIKSDIIDKVLLRDLPSLYGITDVQELNRFFTTLAYNTGNEVSLEKLTKQSGVAKNTVKRYLEYLEAAFLIRSMVRVDRTGKRFQRITTFKVFLTNPSMRAALFGPVNSESDTMGALTETAIYSQLLHDHNVGNHYYARWNTGEVDLVYLGRSPEPEWAMEIKWSDRPFSVPAELKHLVAFAKQHGLDWALATTRSIHDRKTIDGVTIWYIPSSLITYVYGGKTSERAQWTFW